MIAVESNILINILSLKLSELNTCYIICQYFLLFIYRFMLIVVIVTFLQLNCIISQDASKELTISDSIITILSSLLVILVHPLPINTTVNSGQVKFTCTARADFIIFVVNNTPATNTDITNKGFYQQGTSDPINNTISRVLLADPKESNNNTNISCVGSNISPSSDDISNRVLLLIQGRQYRQ